MSTIKTRGRKALVNENKWLKEEVKRLREEIDDVKTRQFRLFMYDGEFEKTIAEKLELTSLQTARLRLLFSIEHCRAVGVPEENIIKYEDVEKHVTKYETAEES